MKSPKHAIAIIGMACQYPDANSPQDLWENILSGRRAFRQIPEERLSNAYFHTGQHHPDTTYNNQAAVLKGFSFDRQKFRVSGKTFRAADMAHWLALSVADKALEDAGFPEGKGLPLANTGVLVGNSLTGEFSRAATLRLRWPYVSKVVNAKLKQQAWERAERQQFLDDLEALFKAPFEPLGEESLAGGLSNTIAGRICNHYNFNGGGYTLDGACSSSLLAVHQACAAIETGDLEVALAGGVDLSLDPFELAGFSATLAMAKKEMLVYDQRSQGFWPGEGCGFVVLTSLEKALNLQITPYAIIRGWGISSDGSGGLTRPKEDGHRLAMQRAYTKAGYQPDQIGYFEGHGTGTPVGDETELTTIINELKEASNSNGPVVVGSVKSNIGHTKAAAGVAGLIKATLALHHQILPPHTGLKNPHRLFKENADHINYLSQAQCWPANIPLKAGVSAMGFGGINVHITLENGPTEKRTGFGPTEKRLIHSKQDAELFLFTARDPKHLITQIEQLLLFANQISLSELTDLAVFLSQQLDPALAFRAAFLANSPGQLSQRLQILKDKIQQQQPFAIDQKESVFYSPHPVEASPSVTFLFPGQAAPVRRAGGIYTDRFDLLDDLFDGSIVYPDSEQPGTDVAQPTIVRSTLAGLRLMSALGIEANNGIGHSLGELCALHWAGVMDEESLLQLAETRGKIMTALKGQPGGMLSIRANEQALASFVQDSNVVFAGFNSSKNTVVSGELHAVQQLAAKLKAEGISNVLLPVSNAFHSPAMKEAIVPLKQQLEQMHLAPARANVVSTITGKPLQQQDSIISLLTEQLTNPVQFQKAIQEVSASTDLFIEIGPGQVLQGLVHDNCTKPVISLDTCGASLSGLLQATGAAFVLGCPINMEVLFHNRFCRPFSMDWKKDFLINPCEAGPVLDDPDVSTQHEVAAKEAIPAPSAMAHQDNINTVALLRTIIARQVELPSSAIQDDFRMLDDLHLNSITVGQLLATACTQLNIPTPATSLEYANASLIEMATALDQLQTQGAKAGLKKQELPKGIDPWIQVFKTEPKAITLGSSPLSDNPVPSIGNWQIFAAHESPLLAQIKIKLATKGGNGVVVWLSNSQEDREKLQLLLQATHSGLPKDQEARFIVIQHATAGAAFAKSLHLEFPDIHVGVIQIPTTFEDTALLVQAIQNCRGFKEIHIDEKGRCTEPILQATYPEKQPLLLNEQDIVVVTGGGKGLAAECAFELARKHRIRLVLLGRSKVKTHPELAANLDRFATQGVNFKYHAVDVTDAAALKSVLAKVQVEWGPITGIIHGAGINQPAGIMQLSTDQALQTYATKVAGLQHLLDAVDAKKLRLLVAFSSIIGRMGMQGNADYAFANEHLSRLTTQWHAAHPSCRCLSLEWSVWAGIGMGEQLGVLENLRAQGVSAIPLDKGLAVFQQLIHAHVPEASVVVSSRFGLPPTLKMDQSPLPFLRYLEKPVVQYPGIEIIVETTLAAGTDLYLQDHILDGEPLLPAVLGLEAMVQVAKALTEQDRLPVLKQVKFLQPIVVPRHGTLNIQLMAQCSKPGIVDVAIRCANTQFLSDHFRATCDFTLPEHPAAKIALPKTNGRLPIDVDKHLYDRLLFHKGSFQLVKGYHKLSATDCLANIQADLSTQWFSVYLPPTLLLGDPGSRDASIHAIQACIPYSAIIPVGVDNLQVLDVTPVEQIWVSAIERSREKDRFVYDLQVWDDAGNLREHWQGLQLQAVPSRHIKKSLPFPFFGVALERKLQVYHPQQPCRVLLAPNHGKNGSMTPLLLQQLYGPEVKLVKRPDGKPELAGSQDRVSAAHTNQFAMLVAGKQNLSCDLEEVRLLGREKWLQMLGQERFALVEMIMEQNNGQLDLAATQVWTVMECLKKVGAPHDASILLLDQNNTHWLHFECGTWKAVSGMAYVDGQQEHLIATILTQSTPDEIL